MKTVTDPAVLTQLVGRLNALRPDTQRRWGTLTAGEMLCHLGDAAASVLNQASSEAGPRRPLLKWIALSSPLSWPRGLPTPPDVDPRGDGTKPGDFEADRQRAIEGLRTFAAAPASALTSSHGAFGPMTARDWQRWAYRHTDHHLRQFGL
ncbi:MAG: DinB family protein [Planctomycetota bacterium]